MSDIVVDPVRRQRYRFSRDGADLIAEVEADPGGDVPEHLHPHQTETWEVLEGDVTFLVGGVRQRAAAGDTVRAAPGVPHAFVNDGAERAVLRVRVSPAGELEGFLTEAARLARAGAFDQRGIPASPRAALTLLKVVVRYRRDVLITAPAPARVLAWMLRRVPERRDRISRAATSAAAG